MKVVKVGGYAGVDVGKDKLDFGTCGAEGEPGDHWETENNTAGILKGLKQLKGYQPKLIVVEASGGYEMAIVMALTAAGLVVAMVNPRQPRKFAEAIGKLAKTDRIDALMLARFAQAIKPTARALPDAEKQAFSALSTQRRHMVTCITAEKNRLRQAHPDIRTSIQHHRVALRKELASLDARLSKKISKTPAYLADTKLLRSVKGVAGVVSLTLIAELPELGHLSRREIAALVGLAPISNDSGKRKGKRAIRGGRSEVRSMLYMAAMSASQHEPLFMAFYERLLKAGKLPRVAIIAVARKLLTILNAIMKSRQPFRKVPQGA
jgi:transposase